MNGLIDEINKKSIELNDLKMRYNQQVEQEKEKVLKSNITGMNKSLYLLGFEFESSSTRTDQYLEFHRVFKREFTKMLKPYTKEVLVQKPNHFDISGFFKLNNEDIYYFSISDLRWSKDNMLIRTATDFKDYTGGVNQYITLNEYFAENLKRFLGIKEGISIIGL